MNRTPAGVALTVTLALLPACGTPQTFGPDDGGVACALGTSVFNDSAQVNATSTSSWSCSPTTRLMTGNGVPDHPVLGGHFATPISAQSLSVTFARSPTVTSPTGTALSHTASGYVLNSVKLDPGTDGTCSSSATSTSMGAGCVAIMGRDPWSIEALGGAFQFGTDESNAHVQPNGQYHYHGMPEAYLARVGAGQRVTLVGFAVDGFPIYARWGYSVPTDAGSELKVMRGSYQTKDAPDPGRPSTSVFPLGTFTQDYRYVEGSGDLDECNGRVGVTPEFPAGTYHYYLTDTYPFIQRCVKGSP
jgi:hypothetical protein